MPKNTLKSKQFNRVLSANKIKFKDGSSIELIGIQTEKNSTRREFVEFQPENCQKTLEAILLDEKNVFVEIISGDEEGEMYGYLWIGNSKELRNVNALLLQEGLAKVVRISDVTKYDESFHVIEQEAYRSKLGIWKEIDKSREIIIMMKMCNEKRNSIKRQQQLRSEVTKMTESSCFNCPILIENRKVLGNKKLIKNV